MRRTFLSRLLAVSLVVLIVLPFTAPFQAYDAGAPIAKTSSSDLKTSDKLSHDAAIVAAMPTALCCLRDDRVRVRHATSNQRRHAIRPTVLRV
jgi:hypothetical protein